MKGKSWFVAASLLAACFGLGSPGCSRWSAQGPAAQPEQSPAEGAVEQGAAEGTEDPTGFPFPEDRGGKLLAQRLPPSQNEGPRNALEPSQPRRLADLATRGLPDQPLPPLAPELSRAVLEKAVPPVLPWKLPDEPPLARGLLDPVLPETPLFPAGSPVGLPSPDPEQPPPVPILAQPPPAQGSLDDPTVAFSAAAVLAAPLPERTAPAPFIRLTLPDPFEHRNAVWSPAPPGLPTLPFFLPPLPVR